MAEDEAGWGITYLDDTRVASPERLAWEARERGDRWFQIDLPVFVTQGIARMGGTATRNVRPDLGDFIGKIEEQGWALKHVSTCFVDRGHASTKRAQMIVATSADDVATHGEVSGLYVFKRAG